MTARYQSVRVDDVALREGMKALAHKRRRFGYLRLHVLLRREGHAVNCYPAVHVYMHERAQAPVPDVSRGKAACAAAARQKTRPRNKGSDADPEPP